MSEPNVDEFMFCVADWDKWDCECYEPISSVNDICRYVCYGCCGQCLYPAVINTW